MKRFLSLFTVFFLSGCMVVPIERNFPDAPKQLMQSCQELSLVEKDETKLSNVLVVVVENYTKYHECSIKVESWIDWYQKQKENFDGVK